MTTEIEASYITIRPHGLVDRQKQIGLGTVVDLDDDDNVVGIEIIGNVNLQTVLLQALTVAKFPKSPI